MPPAGQTNPFVDPLVEKKSFVTREKNIYFASVMFDARAKREQ